MRVRNYEFTVKVEMKTDGVKELHEVGFKYVCQKERYSSFENVNRVV